MKSTTLLLALGFLALSCSSENESSESTKNNDFEQIDYHSDVCEFTGEEIEVVRYGGRMEMENGDEFNFMSAECLAGYYLNLSDASQVKSLKAVDFKDGKRLLDVEDLVFLQSSLRPSPNNMNLTAIDASDEKMINNIYDAYPGEIMDWEEVLELVEDEWNLPDSNPQADLK